MTADGRPAGAVETCPHESDGTAFEQAETQAEAMDRLLSDVGAIEDSQTEMDREMARMQVSLQDVSARQRRASVVRFAIAGSMLVTTVLLIAMLTPAAGSPVVRVFAVVAVVFQVVVVACAASGTRM